MLIFDIALVWFRRDLRNFGHAALKQSRRVFCTFIFDRNGKAVLKHKLAREAVLSTFANMPVAMIGIEACAGSKRKNVLNGNRFCRICSVNSELLSKKPATLYRSETL